MQLEQRAATCGTLKLLLSQTQDFSPLFIIQLPPCPCSWSGAVLPRRVVVLVAWSLPSSSPPPSSSRPEVLVEDVVVLAPVVDVEGIGFVLWALVDVGCVGGVGAGGGGGAGAAGGGAGAGGCDGDGSGFCVDSIGVGVIRVTLDSPDGVPLSACASSDDGKDVGAGIMTVKSLSAKPASSFGSCMLNRRRSTPFPWPYLCSCRLLFCGSFTFISEALPPPHIEESSTMGPHIVAHCTGILSGGSASPTTPVIMNEHSESIRSPLCETFIVSLFESFERWARGGEAAAAQNDQSHGKESLGKRN